ncbi:PH domain-containing protein [Micromonospora sp. CPCC 206061]|uniref:PH domain-containing protein n=1 Tax=Micromonospora sp. CPCC 206061 TaxID=3122410 RepID=UPI002FF0FCD6
MDACSWRVPRKIPIVKFTAAAGVLAIGLLFDDGDVVRLVLAAMVTAGLAGWGARDLIAPVRIAADTDGLTVVTGLAGRRRLAWSQIEGVRVDTRPRLGMRTETLEIDAGDTILLFSESDLGTPPSDVAATLSRLSPP